MRSLCSKFADWRTWKSTFQKFCFFLPRSSNFELELQLGIIRLGATKGFFVSEVLLDGWFRLKSAITRDQILDQILLVPMGCLIAISPNWKISFCGFQPVAGWEETSCFIPALLCCYKFSSRSREKARRSVNVNRLGQLPSCKTQ